jgi:hypothetical protein
MVGSSPVMRRLLDAADDAPVCALLLLDARTSAPGATVVLIWSCSLFWAASAFGDWSDLRARLELSCFKTGADGSPAAVTILLAFGAFKEACC